MSRSDSVFVMVSNLHGPPGPTWRLAVTLLQGKGSVFAPGRFINILLANLPYFSPPGLQILVVPPVPEMGGFRGINSARS